MNETSKWQETDEDGNVTDTYYAFDTKAGGRVVISNGAAIFDDDPCVAYLHVQGSNLFTADECNELARLLMKVALA